MINLPSLPKCPRDAACIRGAGHPGGCYDGIDLQLSVSVAPPNDSRLPHGPCCYCDKDAVSGLAIEHSGLRFCSVSCLWDAAFCDGFDAALDKIRAQKFEPIGDVLDALELEIINTTPRREPAKKGGSRS